MDEDTLGFRSRLAATARWSAVALLLASLASGILTLVIGSNKIIPSVSLTLGILAVVPTAMDAWEKIQHNARGGRYHAWTERQAARILLLIQRRRRSRILATYGRHELAARLLPSPEAAWFSVASHTRRTRRARRVVILGVAIVLVVGAAAITTHVTFSSHHRDMHYRLHEEFALGSVYRITVDGAPTCKASEQPSLPPMCTMPVTIRNVTRDPHSLGSGSFGYVTSAGPQYQIYDGPPLNYAASLVGPHGNYYYDGSLKEFKTSEFPPGAQAEDDLTFDAPPGTQITELVLDVREDDRITIYVSFDQQ